MGTFSRTVKKMVGIHEGRISKSWNYDSKSSLLCPPCVADINKDGKPEIIIGTKEGELIVLTHDAQELWRYNVKEEVNAVEEMFLDEDTINSINATPAIADLTGDGKSNIIFGSELGILYCLDERGGVVWKHKTEGGIRGSPLIADVNQDGKPEVVFGTTDKYLYLLDNNGKLIERFEQESPVESTPGYHKGIIVFGTNNGKIIAITADGQEKWQYQTEGRITAAPAFDQLTASPVDYLIIGSTDNKVYCLDIDGELVWNYETKGAVYSQATIADINKDQKKEIIVGSCDNNIHAITSEGERLWTYETDFWVVSTPLVADIDDDGDLEVIAGSYDHNIYVLDSEGTYLLDYVPGLSGVVQQAGHYSDIMTQEPGEHVGKKLWQFKTEGVVVGCSQVGSSKGLVVATKIGIVDGITHKT